jgi:hypothetical protein
MRSRAAFWLGGFVMMYALGALSRSITRGPSWYWVTLSAVTLPSLYVAIVLKRRVR